MTEDPKDMTDEAIDKEIEEIHETVDALHIRVRELRNEIHFRLTGERL